MLCIYVPNVINCRCFKLKMYHPMLCWKFCNSDFTLFVGYNWGVTLVVSKQVGLSGQCCLMLLVPWYATSVWNTVHTCLLSSRLVAGVGLKISGGEALLLGYVSVVRCWFSMLLLATVQAWLKFCCFPR